MDLVTQAVLGAAIGEAGWGKRFGPSAMRAGALLGMLPDLDIVAGLAGQWASLVHHRGVSHSLLFAPLMCAPLGYLAWRASGRRGAMGAWMHLAFWAMWTHPLLDVFTSYGTQLFAPLSDARYALDGVSIIDPLYTLPLAAALIAASRWREAHPGRGARLCAAMLVATTCYLGFGTTQAYRARAAASAELERQDHPDLTRVRALPTFANLWLWRVIAQDSEGHTYVGQHSLIAPGPIRFTRIVRPETPLIPAILADERGRIFHWFADNWIGYSVEEQAGGALTVRMVDLRYGGVIDPATPMWGADARFEGGALVDIARFQERDRIKMGAELAALWRKLWRGGDAP
jgi:inner membrane protein